MSLKQHTIIFVPHARARFRKFRITNHQLRLVVGAVAIFTAASVFTTWTFFTNAIDRNELTQVRSENEDLRQINQDFEVSIRELEKQLSDFEERTRKLAIVAGLDSLGDDPAAGIGGESLYTNVQPPQKLSLLHDRADGLSSALEEVSSGFRSQELLANSRPSIAPVRGIFTSSFGWRIDPITRKRASHLGIDIATNPGRPVQATADGLVVHAGRSGGLGNAVYVKHAFDVVTRYGHLSSIAVTPGQRVSRFDTIGHVGTTGRSTGYHLHYEVLVGGKAENPVIYMLDRDRPRG
ncbi:MAG: M23 family metallopeptidase [Acidobacteriota bacterium]|nr:M23 family metallopeptidase [Acidobacteriota bacterium]